MRISREYSTVIVDPFVTYWHPAKVGRAIVYRELEFVLDPKRTLSDIQSSGQLFRRACETGVGPSLNSAPGALWRAWCIWVGAPYCLSWATSKKVLWLQLDPEITPLCKSLQESLYTMSCLASEWYRREKKFHKGLLDKTETAHGVEWLMETEGMSKVGVAQALEQAMPWSHKYGRQILELVQRAQPITVRYRQVHDEMQQTITIEGVER